MEMLYQIENGIIKISRYKVIYRQYYDSYVNGVDADEPTSNERYFKNADDAQGFVERYLSKHKALEYVETKEIDTSKYDWIDGIEIPSGYSCAQDYIDELLEMGEDGYELLLASATENYLLDLDCRLSMIELGV